ncbi:MAG: phosphotransferase [Steroidobacteraceae bacterium]|nr:phosphotransferase [Steroidobacteraceae bacterium]
MPDRVVPPPADECELRSHLRACAATCPLADGVLTRIEGGLSNHAWRLEVDGTRWFVRLGSPQAARLGVDRQNEYALLTTVSAAGLAPQLWACEPATGLLVTAFVDGETWSASTATEDSNIRRVAARLRELHELPVPPGIRRVDYERQARHLAGSLPPGDGAASVLGDRAAAAFARIGRERSATTLCHNDLHHLNLLDDGRQLWLVDWEYGGRGDPLFDVAGFLALHDLGPGPTAVLVEAYGRFGPADLRALDAARWAFDYVQWLWYRSRFPNPVGDEAWYAERLAQRLLRCNN